jgi:hypothetical protein
MRKGKLTNEVVKSIRDQKAAGVKQNDIARKHGVSQASVSRIIRGTRHAKTMEAIVIEQEQSA